MSDAYLLLLGVAAVVVLIFLNGLFVAAEFSFVAVRRSRVEQLAAEGRSRARLLLGTLRHLDRAIAATQLGITMAGLALGWLGEPVLASILEPPISFAIGSFAADAVSHVVAVILAFALVTALVIIFAELAPKSIALGRAEGVALWIALPLAVFMRVFAPFVWLLNRAGRLVVRGFGVSPAGEKSEELEPEELELVIEASARAGLLSTSELLLARRALEFSAIQADQIMVPRTELVAIDADDPLDEVLTTVERHQHTRYPVFEEDLDHILGILDAKDLLALVRKGGREWRPLVRPAVAIPESVSVEVAVAAMRARQVQIVVLVDEHGGTSGILTADEVLYRLLGRWLGRRSHGADSVRSLPTGNLLLSGLALVADVEDVTGAELSDDDYDTVGGFIMSRLGRIPRVGDRIDVPGYQFRVMAMDGRRVDRVLVVKQAPPTAGAHPGSRQQEGRAS
ncbi:MAG: HlyC/CorC family transporter [Dehalococcoidia bacterium]|nr:HlyC/CorC family transporter [Dehalococcoidia bacterium]